MKKISYLLTDTDGCLTDNRIGFTHEGKRIRFYNAYDIEGVYEIEASGITVFIVSGARDARKFARYYGFNFIHLPNDKLESLVSLYKTAPNWGSYDFLAKNFMEEIAFIGNDHADIRLLQAVGLPMCPQDAAWKVKQVVRERGGYILPVNGGDGILRYVAEVVLGNLQKPSS